MRDLNRFSNTTDSPLDKENTDDIRDSTSLKIAKYLLEKGIKINCYDPVAMENAKNELPSLNYCNSSFVCQLVSE